MRHKIHTCVCSFLFNMCATKILKRTQKAGHLIKSVQSEESKLISSAII
jgi:hypothetical protein